MADTSGKHDAGTRVLPGTREETWLVKASRGVETFRLVIDVVRMAERRRIRETNERIRRGF